MRFGRQSGKTARLANRDKYLEEIVDF